MSIATIVTRGYGTFGSIALVVTRGFATLAAEVVVAVTPPGGTSSKRKFARRLSEETIQRLKEKVHKKRRTIWERPKPEEVPSEAVEPVAYVDRAFLQDAELVLAAADLERARSELEAERQRRQGEATELERRRAQRVADIKRQAELEAEEEAVIALLLAA